MELLRRDTTATVLLGQILRQDKNPNEQSLPSTLVESMVLRNFFPSLLVQPEQLMIFQQCVQAAFTLPTVLAITITSLNAVLIVLIHV